MVSLREAMDEKGRSIQAREKDDKELRLAQEARQWAEDLGKEKEKEIALMIKENRYIKKLKKYTTRVWSWKN